jgi:hypothetical protein
MRKGFLTDEEMSKYLTIYEEADKKNLLFLSMQQTIIRVQNINPRPSLSPKHDKMPIRVTALAFDLCVLYFCSPCTL